MKPCLSHTERSQVQADIVACLRGISRLSLLALRAIVGTGIVAAGILVSPISAMAQAVDQPPMLLSAPPGVGANRGASSAHAADRAVVRQRQVSINFQNVDPKSGKAASPLGVELFDGQMLTLDPDRVEQRGPNNYTWHGKVRGYARSQAILTVVDGQMAGSITYHDVEARKQRTFQIQSGPGGAQTLREIDPNAFPPDHPPGRENNRVPPQSTIAPAADKPAQTVTSTGGTVTASADTGGTVDVMVVYSNQTATAAGSAIGAQIQQAVDTANTVYANSGITTRLRLVHYEQVAYDESGDFYTDLNRLTTAGDGYMDNVPTLRNTYGADLVSLFIENGQYCGLAWVGPDANYAFSVVNRGCAYGSYTLAHEIGHNFGALHDPYVDSSNSPYAYGHGLTDPAAGWRTVMAYNNACAAAGTSCARIPYFSNPNLTYGNPADPLGTVSTSDVARVHNQNAYTVANFKAGATGGCSYALSPTAANIGAGATNGSFGVTAGAGCAWNSATSASWLTIAPGSGTTASGTLNYSAAANGGPARAASITVGGQAFTVNQATGCTYTLSPSSASVAAGGGTGTFTVTSGAACPWNVSSSASWLTVSSAASGTGSATVSYSVAANTGATRTANLNLGGATFIVTEAAASGTTTVAPAATAALSLSTLNFGNQKVGTTSAVKSVTLTNSGGGTLTITALTSSGSNPGDFSRSGTCAINSALTAGQSCTVQYSFTPSATGNRSATLAVGTSAGTANLKSHRQRIAQMTGR